MKDLLTQFLLADLAAITNSIIWLFLILLFVFQGWIVAQITVFFDNAMDYGHIFDFIRVKKAKEAAAKLEPEVSKSWNEHFERLTKLSNFGERMQQISTHYFSLATKDKKFLLWICPNCMSARINLLLFVVGSLNYCVFANKINILILFVYFLVSIASTVYYINKE